MVTTLKNCLATTLILTFLHLDGTLAQTHGDEHAGPTMNFHRVDARLATGGHFVADGLADLHGQGVRVIIDLRDEPPAGQRRKVEALGIEWINIPVVWRSPQQEDFQRFREAMARHGSDNVLVQCQANYRASAMTYLYRVVADDVPESVAREDLNAVWEPSGRWQEYIDEILESR